ncbi:hypothetical protein MNB_SM-3-1012 [hydrothermal vent metagenome]|uniref:YfdX protein n=1 Tax=hydrothermal vent metagenome TaxID=652676 RepID=A0A1W1D589_9ZZZZ
MKAKIAISTIVTALLMGTTALSANMMENQTSQKDHYAAKLNADNFKNKAQEADAKRLHKVIDKEIKADHLAQKQAPKEIMDGLKSTIMALRALQANNTASAKQYLEEATKSFDTALKNDSKLDLVPVDERIVVRDFTGDAKLVKHIKDATITLLKNNETQAARAMLLPLEDQMTISVQYLPMKIYPEATKQAQKDLANGNNQAAFNDIVTALNSFVIKSVIIPIPLLTAQDMVLEASKLQKQDKEKALKLLTSAQDELQKAVLLGYTKKHSKVYKSLNDEITSIKDNIKGGHSVAKLYEHIKHSFSSLLHLHREEEHTNNMKK